jgi:hypothetical protein
MDDVLIDERIDREVDEMARKLMDCCNLEHPAVSLTALFAAAYHLAHQLVHSDEFMPQVTNEELVAVCQRQGIRYAWFLDETRHTIIAPLQKA